MFTTHLYKSVQFTEKRPRRPGYGIKQGSEEMEHDFPLEQSVRKNRTTFSNVPLLPKIFRWNDTKSRLLFIFQLQVLETFCKI